MPKHDLVPSFELGQRICVEIVLEAIERIWLRVHMLNKFCVRSEQTTFGVDIGSPKALQLLADKFALQICPVVPASPSAPQHVIPPV
jgi:hypothetical protein